MSSTSISTSTSSLPISSLSFSMSSSSSTNNTTSSSTMTINSTTHNVFSVNPTNLTLNTNATPVNKPKSSFVVSSPLNVDMNLFQTPVTETKAPPPPPLTTAHQSEHPRSVFKRVMMPKPVVEFMKDTQRDENIIQYPAPQLYRTSLSTTPPMLPSLAILPGPTYTWSTGMEIGQQLKWDNTFPTSESVKNLMIGRAFGSVINGKQKMDDLKANNYPCTKDLFLALVACPYDRLLVLQIYRRYPDALMCFLNRTNFYKPSAGTQLEWISIEDSISKTEYRLMNLEIDIFMVARQLGQTPNWPQEAIVKVAARCPPMYYASMRERYHFSAMDIKKSVDDLTALMDRLNKKSANPDPTSIESIFSNSMMVEFRKQAIMHLRENLKIEEQVILLAVKQLDTLQNLYTRVVTSINNMYRQCYSQQPNMNTMVANTLNINPNLIDKVLEDMFRTKQTVIDKKTGKCTLVETGLDFDTRLDAIIEKQNSLDAIVEKQNARNRKRKNVGEITASTATATTPHTSDTTALKDVVDMSGDQDSDTTIENNYSNNNSNSNNTNNNNNKRDKLSNEDEVVLSEL